MTAAATTGPASGPRPASSTPANRPGASKCSAICSGLDALRDRIGGKARSVALEQMVQFDEAGLRLRRARRIIQPAQRLACQRLRRGGLLDQLRHDELARQDVG